MISAVTRRSISSSATRSYSGSRRQGWSTARETIDFSRLVDGEVLPSVRQMADEIGINMHTVNKAYTILRQEGFVKVDRRRGAFISVDERNRERAIAMVEKEMRVLLAEARCRGLSRNDILMLVDRIYDEYDGVRKEQL